MNDDLSVTKQLLVSYAKSTLLIMTRLNALERAMTDLAPRSKLWSLYLKHVDLARNSPTPQSEERMLRAETELDRALVDLRSLVEKAEKL